MLNEKLFQTNKIKKKIKGNSFLLMSNSINKSSSDLPNIKKKFKSFSFTIFKMNNKVCKMALHLSIMKNVATFLVKNSIKLLILSEKNFFIKSKFFQFYTFFFPILGCKFNNKFYSKKTLKGLHSFSYYQSKQVLLQTCVLNFKKIQVQKSK